MIFDDIYDLLSVSISTIGNIPTLANGILYTKAHKHHKCYNCHKYGHIAKHCGKICEACGTIHQFKFCIKDAICKVEKIIDNANKINKKLIKENGKDCMNTIKAYIRRNKLETQKMYAQAMKVEQNITKAYDKLKEYEKQFKYNIEKAANKTKNIMDSAINKINSFKFDKNIRIEAQLTSWTELLFGEYRSYTVNEIYEQCHNAQLEINKLCKDKKQIAPYKTRYEIELDEDDGIRRILTEHGFNTEEETNEMIRLINAYIDTFNKNNYSQQHNNNASEQINRITFNAFKMINDNIMKINTQMKYDRYDRNKRSNKDRILKNKKSSLHMNKQNNNKNTNTIVKPMKPAIDANRYDGDAAVEDRKQEKYYDNNNNKVSAATMKNLFGVIGKKPEKVMDEKVQKVNNNKIEKVDKNIMANLFGLNKSKAKDDNKNQVNEKVLNNLFGVNKWKNNGVQAKSKV